MILKANINLNLSGEITIDVVQSLRVFITATCDGTSAKGESYMAYTLPNDKQVDVAVSYVDAHGNPVDLPQGNVSWEVSDDTIITCTAGSTDDQTAKIAPSGTLGNAQVTCTGKNPDGSQVIATLDLTVVAGNAVTGTIQPVNVTPVP